MSVRVNLLPAAIRAKGREARQRTWALLAGALVLAALVGAYGWAVLEVRAAEDELAAERTRTASLVSEQTELVAFRELADRREAAAEAIQTAMVPEASLAGVLQDLASVVPADTQLETIAIDLTAPSEETAFGVGSFSLTGRTITSHAPGVERVLTSLDRIASFRGAYLNSSALEERDGEVVTFSVDGRIGPEALTGRYDAGLPEELR